MTRRHFVPRNPRELVRRLRRSIDFTCRVLVVLALFIALALFIFLLATVYPESTTSGLLPVHGLHALYAAMVLVAVEQLQFRFSHGVVRANNEAMQAVMVMSCAAMAAGAYSLFLLATQVSRCDTVPLCNNVTWLYATLHGTAAACLLASVAIAALAGVVARKNRQLALLELFTVHAEQRAEGGDAPVDAAADCRAANVDYDEYMMLRESGGIGGAADFGATRREVPTLGVRPTRPADHAHWEGETSTARYR